MVWYSHFSQNFPQFIVIHTVKGFSIVNEVEVGIFLEFSCVFCDPVDFFFFFKLLGDTLGPQGGGVCVGPQQSGLPRRPSLHPPAHPPLLLLIASSKRLVLRQHKLTSIPT